jgi:hypothetical protein
VLYLSEVQPIISLLKKFFLDEMEYEKAVMEVIGKRRQGTKMCKDILEKTLAIEKKSVV